MAGTTHPAKEQCQVLIPSKRFSSASAMSPLRFYQHGPLSQTAAPSSPSWSPRPGEGDGAMMDGATSAPSVRLPDHGCSISIDFLSFFFFSYVCAVANCWSRSITLHSPGRERAELAASQPVPLRAASVKTIPRCIHWLIHLRSCLQEGGPR